MSTEEHAGSASGPAWSDAATGSRAPVPASRKKPASATVSAIHHHISGEQSGAMAEYYSGRGFVCVMVKGAGGKSWGDVREQEGPLLIVHHMTQLSLAVRQDSTGRTGRRVANIES